MNTNISWKLSSCMNLAIKIIFVYLPNNVKTLKVKDMFSERIKELRIQKQMPQRQLAAALDIDTATYCKIEKGDRRAKRQQVEIIAGVLNIDKTELVTLWLADKVQEIVKHEYNASHILSIAQKTL